MTGKFVTFATRLTPRSKNSAALTNFVAVSVLRTARPSETRSVSLEFRHGDDGGVVTVTCRLPTVAAPAATVIGALVAGWPGPVELAAVTVHESRCPTSDPATVYVALVAPVVVTPPNATPSRFH